jgi:hypothetical protein
MARNVSPNGLIVTSHCFTPEWNKLSQDKPPEHQDAAFCLYITSSSASELPV